MMSWLPPSQDRGQSNEVEECVAHVPFAVHDEAGRTGADCVDAAEHKQVPVHAASPVLVVSAVLGD